MQQKDIKNNKKPFILSPHYPFPASMGERGALLYEILLKTSSIALDFYQKRHDLNVDYKKNKEIFSNADVTIEKIIQKSIFAQYPKENFLGEEDGLIIRENNEKKSIENEGCWVIDPIDGTNNFLRGLDCWSICIAYVKKGEILATGIINPTKKEMFLAEKGLGSYLNGKRLEQIKKNNKQHHLKKIIGIGFHRTFPLEFQYEIFRILKENRIDIRFFSCCSLMLCEVVKQSLIAHYEPFIESWDCLAGCLLLEEIGAQRNDFFKENNRDGLLNGNRLLVSQAEHFENLDSILPRLNLDEWVNKKC